MITHLVSDAVNWLNQFPRKAGVSNTLSPSAIVTCYRHWRCLTRLPRPRPRPRIRLLRLSV